MKAERATIHFGLAKTGTTYLQEYLAGHRPLLLQQYGILYPSFGKNHYHIQTILSKEPQSLIQVRRERFLKEEEVSRLIEDIKFNLKSEIQEKKPREILISSEYFTSMADDELPMINDFFLQFAKQVRAIVYMRDPWSQSVSMAQQNIRDGRQGAPVELLYGAAQVWMIRKLERMFGNDLIVRPFLRGKKLKTDIVQDFFQALRLIPFSDQNGIALFGNPSMGRIGASVLAQLNNLWPKYDENKVMIYSPLRDICIGSLVSSKFKDYPIKLSRRRAEQILEACKADLHYIHRSFFKGEPVFHDFYGTETFDEFNCDISMRNVKVSQAIKFLLYALPGWAHRMKRYYK